MKVKTITVQLTEEQVNMLDGAICAAITDWRNAAGISQKLIDAKCQKLVQLHDYLAVELDRQTAGANYDNNCTHEGPYHY